MKKLTLIALIITLFHIANAQDFEGDKGIILGGSVNFLIQNNTYPFSSVSGIGGIYSNGTDNIKNTIFSINPSFGKEISQNLLVGFQLDYRIGKFKAEDIRVFGGPNTVDLERNSNQIGIGLFTRHVLNPNNQFSFFIQPYLEYNLLLNEEVVHDSNITQEEKANYFELGAGLGLLYDINNRMRATLSSGGLKYVNGKWENKTIGTKKDFSSFGTSINLSTIYFGFEIKI